MEKQGAVTPSHALAERIYVELIGRHTEVMQGSVKMAASATNLAVLSLKLADAFFQAQAGAIAAKEPPKDYKLQGADIASWSK
jgi:hypothetical protein